MAKSTTPTCKNVKVHQIHFGHYYLTADFKSNGHDALKFMKWLNDERIAVSEDGKLSPDHFYFVTCIYNGKKAAHIMSKESTYVHPDFALEIQKAQDAGKMPKDLTTYVNPR